MDQEIVTCSMASQFQYPIPLPLLEDQFTYATEAVVLWTALQRSYGHSVHRLTYWEANNPSGVVATSLIGICVPECILMASLMNMTPAEAYSGQIQGQYLAASMAALFLWDHAITLGQEVQFIWSSSGWSLVKVLFILIRYGISIGYPISLYDVFSRVDKPGVCEVAYGSFILFTILGHMVQLVLHLRVWALYNRNIWATVFLILNYLGVLAVSVHLSVKIIGAGRAELPPNIPGIPPPFGCPMNPVDSYYRSLIAALISETVIVVMTIRKVLLHLRHSRNIPFVNYLLSSGVAYYVAIFAALIINILTKPIPMLRQPVIGSSCIMIVQGTACCRIVLGLMRHAGKAVTPMIPTRTSCYGEESALQDFLTVPTGIYTREMLEEWEFGLPPSETDGEYTEREEDGLSDLDTLSPTLQDA